MNLNKVFKEDYFKNDFSDEVKSNYNFEKYVLDKDTADDLSKTASKLSDEKVDGINVSLNQALRAALNKAHRFPKEEKWAINEFIQQLLMFKINMMNKTDSDNWKNFITNTANRKNFPEIYNLFIPDPEHVRRFEDARAKAIAAEAIAEQALRKAQAQQQSKGGSNILERENKVFGGKKGTRKVKGGKRTRKYQKKNNQKSNKRHNKTR